ncbi:MAG TPA: hypothetical protein VGR78_17485 [Verrucomicrobiae bacterium]|jgi:hypothetical protein|nr:hypothetical protein [Verrucomicrobiae bacterium]
MKASTVISGLIVVGLAGWIVFQHRSQSKLRAENRRLQARLDQLGVVAAENQRLSNRLAQADQAAAFSTEQLNELLRLRGEVTDLRKKGVKPHQPRTTPAVAQDAPLPTNKPAEATERKIIPKESIKFAGYATPEAALQSAVWSMMNGDVITFVGGMTPEAREGFAQQMDGKTDAEISDSLREEAAGIGGLRLDRKKSTSDTQVSFVISSHQSDNGATINREEAVLTFKNIAGEWKYAP